MKDNTITDADIDMFAGIISNILNREDLKAPGTDFDKLRAHLSERYVGNVRMTPLVARMYQVIRMYMRFSPQALTAIEQKEIQEELDSNARHLFPVLFVFTDEDKTIASCWFKDMGDMSGIAKKLEHVMNGIETASELYDATLDDNSNKQLRYAIFTAMAADGSGLDKMDKNGIALVEEFADSLDDKALIESPYDGIIAITPDGVERNSTRRGAKVRIDLSTKTVNMDCYTVYGLDFYKKITGDDDFTLDGKEAVRSCDAEFSFSDYEEAVSDWTERLGDTFAIPGSQKLVGTKKPIVAQKKQEESDEE